jgi:negative modulator of initiation of replication
MKNIEIDEDLYHYIATNTQFIGESASSILRRLLAIEKPVEAPIKTAVKAPSKVTKTEVSSKIVASESTTKTIEKTPKKVTKKSTVVTKNKNLNDTVFNYINKEELAMQRGAVGRFLLILAALYRGNAQQFFVVNEISGRDRLYFANSEQELDASGSSTKPRQIPESPFWVITNSNTTRKKMMLTKVATALGYSDKDAEKIRELL